MADEQKIIRQVEPTCAPIRPLFPAGKYASNVCIIIDITKYLSSIRKSCGCGFFQSRNRLEYPLLYADDRRDFEDHQISILSNNKRGKAMAKFTLQGGLKLVCIGDRAALSFDAKDPHPCRVAELRFVENPSQIQKNKVRLSGSGMVCSAGKNSSISSLEEHLQDDGNGYDDDYENDELACFRGLVLDISYRPVNVVCWRRAICLEFMEKADVLEYYNQTVASPSGSFYIPAVLRVPHLLQVVKRRRVRNYLSRKNIFFRDQFTCQYCSSHDNLTIDHILPIARGGEWKWENLVTACSKCNSRKGQKTIQEANMELLKVPKAPKDFDILAIPLTTTTIKMMRMRKMPNEWRQYLSKSCFNS